MRAAVGGNWLRAWEPWIDPHVHRSHLTVVGMNQRLRHMLHILSADFQRLQGCGFVDDGQRCFHVRRSCREVMQRSTPSFWWSWKKGSYKMIQIHGSKKWMIRILKRSSEDRILTFQSAHKIIFQTFTTRNSSQLLDGRRTYLKPPNNYHIFRCRVAHPIALGREVRMAYLRVLNALQP